MRVELWMWRTMLVLPEQGRHRLASFDAGHGICRQVVLGQGVAQAGDEDAIRRSGLRAAFEDDAVTGAKGQRADLDHRLGAALEDDQENAQWASHLAQLEAVVELRMAQ